MNQKWSQMIDNKQIGHFGPFQTLTSSCDDNGDDDDQKECKGGEKGVQRRGRPHFICLPPVHLLHTEEQQSPVKSGDRKDFQINREEHR